MGIPDFHKKPVYPDELRFAITRKCDGNCRHCYNLSGKDTDKLSSADFIHIMQEVKTVNPGFDRITLTGGEPLVEKDKLIAISTWAKSMKIRVRLVTRGWELNEKICNELKEAGITRIQIGLDSSGKYGYTAANKTVWDTFHSWIRGDKSGFRNTVQAIRLSVQSGLDVSVRFSLCHSNLNDVIETYYFVSSLGVSKFKFRMLFPDGRAKSRLIHELISGEEMALAQFNLIHASRNNNTLVEITQPCRFKLPDRAALAAGNRNLNSHKEICPCGRTAAYVDSNGDVKYCLFDEDVLGNIYHDPFLTIWNSEIVNKARISRCPFDLTGTTCSSFKILYEKFADYQHFIQSYQSKADELSSRFSEVHEVL